MKRHAQTRIGRLARGLALALSLGALGACGGGGGPRQQAPADPETSEPQGAEVVFWYQHTSERETALLAMIDEYNRTNPYGIRVRGEFAGKYDDIYNKMLVGLQGGTLPNLVVAYQNQAREYHHAGGLVDLRPYMDSPRWGLTPADRADYVKAFLAQDFIEGAQICFPPNRSIEILYYNADWLRELGYTAPPVTWEEFAAMCRAAHARPYSRSHNRNRSLGFLFEADASRMATMVFSRGGDMMNEAVTAYTLDTEAMRASLSLMQELKQEGAVDLLSEAFADQSDFAVGQVLFIIRSSSGLPFVASAVEDGGLDFDWNVCAPPYSTPEPVVNAYGASLSVCHSTPARQLASWLFVKWFTAP
ncbi:MAG: extracellular solute-binding protein, partial [Gemmatimonadota bacterium]